MFRLFEHFYFCHCFVFRVSYFEFWIERQGFFQAVTFLDGFGFIQNVEVHFKTIKVKHING